MSVNLSQNVIRLLNVPDSVDGVVNRLRTGWSDIQIPVRARYFSPDGSDWPWRTRSLYPMGSGALFQDGSGMGLKFNTHLYPAPRLGIRGTIPLLPSTFLEFKDRLQ